MMRACPDPAPPPVVPAYLLAPPAGLVDHRRLPHTAAAQIEACQANLRVLRSDRDRLRDLQAWIVGEHDRRGRRRASSNSGAKAVPAGQN